MRLILFCIAIALAAGAFFITMQFTSHDDKGNVIAKPQMIVKDVPTTNIYTAKQDIPIGAIITQDMLDIQPWPSHLMLQDMVSVDDASKPSLTLGMVVRTPFQKGEPIILTKLANDKDPSFLAASLPKGMRVVTVAVDGVSGVAGFVFPGDRVDVLVTHDLVLEKQPEIKPADVKNGIQPPPPRKDPITEVLLSNIRVMAVNQKSTAHGGELPMVPSSVSLEVTASDAQKIRLTENAQGRLSLVLRSLKDKDETELARPTGIGDLSRLTPPAYFPVLYDGSGQAIFANPAAQAEVQKVKEDDSLKSSVLVTRGVKQESVEVSRP